MDRMSQDISQRSIKLQEYEEFKKETTDKVPEQKYQNLINKLHYEAKIRKDKRD